MTEPGAIPDRPIRLGPLDDELLDPGRRALVDDMVIGPTVNIYRSVIRNPDAAAAMVGLGRTLRGSVLPARHREIVILRTGWLCASGYELAQHHRMGLAVGLTETELARIPLGASAEGWEPFEALLCQAADELHGTSTLSDNTWDALAARYDEAQLVQLVMLVGYYHLVSYVLNALGVPIEDQTPPFPAA